MYLRRASLNINDINPMMIERILRGQRIAGDCLWTGTTLQPALLQLSLKVGDHPCGPRCSTSQGEERSSWCSALPFRMSSLLLRNDTQETLSPLQMFLGTRPFFWRTAVPWLVMKTFLFGWQPAAPWLASPSCGVLGGSLSIYLSGSFIKWHTSWPLWWLRFSKAPFEEHHPPEHSSSIIQQHVSAVSPSTEERRGGKTFPSNRWRYDFPQN